MSINRILEGLSNTFDAGNQKQIQAETLTPTFVPTNETPSAEKRGEQQLYGDYLRNQIQARWTLEAQPQQDNFEQKAKELVEKYTPKNVVLVGKFDSKGLGAELAALVPKGARLGAAVFAQLSAGDKADVARAMIDNLNDETLKRMAKTTNGKALLEQTTGLLDDKTTNMWDLRSFASGDSERKTRIQNALGKPQVEQKPQTGEVKQTPQPTQTGEVKLLFEGVKGTAELNKKLLETINAIDPQPTGRKLGGVKESESAAALHSKAMPNHDLKAKFERLGEKYGVPPALIAGIASRESNMGTLFRGKTGPDNVYYGWGDDIPRKGEKGRQFHGFGLIQIDKAKAPFEYMQKELQAAYGKQKLDPFSEEHIEWGVKSFLKKYEDAQNPKLSEANRFATALSKYNGGYKSKDVVYPQNDQRTTEHNYANDTLVRARWFAQNWDKLQ